MGKASDMGKARNIVYICAAMALMAVPSAGLPHKEPASTENRTLASFPSVRTQDGSLNTQVLSDFGDWFGDHFGFRSDLVTADAKVNSSLFQVSSSDQVVLGTDGWLYYANSLPDVQGTRQLSDRALYCIARSARLLQDSLSSRGIHFLMTIVPNKSTLYPDHLPSYCSISTGEKSALERLETFLDGERVHYLDLCDVLQKGKEKAVITDPSSGAGILYHLRDSHWNNQGAAIAEDAMLNMLGKDHVGYDFDSYEVRTDFTGDLDTMLFPRAVTEEDEIYYDRPQTFAYVGEIGSTFDPKIMAVNPSKTGSLIMYRDSFGNALVPFLADEFSSSYFSRSEQYPESDLQDHPCDTFISERAERFLTLRSANPPIFTAPAVLPEGSITDAGDGSSVTSLQASANGDSIVWTGVLSSSLIRSDTRIYVRAGGEMIYEAYPCTVLDSSMQNVVCDSAFQITLPSSLAPDASSLEVLISAPDKEGVLIRLPAQGLPQG